MGVFVTNEEPLWRFILYDKATDQKISILDPVATEKQIQYQLSRPAQCTFKVPSGDPHVNLLWSAGTDSDGLPNLMAGIRNVKCFRREGGSWVLRYAGRVWTVADEIVDGESTGFTSVTCFDPLQNMTKRVVRAADGTFAQQVKFPSTDAALIIQTMMERAITFGLDPWIGIDISSGTIETTTDYATTHDKQLISDAIQALAATGSLDVWIEPKDDESGDIGILNIYARMGTDRSAAVRFMYDTGNRGAQTWQKNSDLTPMGNDVNLFSGSAAQQFSSTAQDAVSAARFGSMEIVDVETDIVEEGVLDELAGIRLLVGNAPQDTVLFTPRPEIFPRVFNDYFIGDTVTVATSSEMREAIFGIQRIYGITLDIDDNGVETVSSLEVSPNQET